MGKILVIVESPAKAKTIGRYLGQDYKIAASVGHVRDLPAATIGVDVKNNFKPRYINMRGKEKVIKELKESAAQADRVLIATDPDREGEAIAWHLATILGIDPHSDCRITFNEITKNTVQAAVASPRSIDLDLVNAQQARRILDRLVGYELSPLLWKKIKKGLSAGRVQSVATLLLVLREEEIKNFVPEEYWHLDAELSKQEQTQTFVARYHGTKDAAGKIKKTTINNEAEATALVETCRNHPFRVDSITNKTKQKNPYAPYTTSTLQQDAAHRLGFTSKKTMSVAQQLYEGIDLREEGATALVTYIRTDSVRSSAEAVAQIRDYIQAKYGSEYLPKQPRVFKNKNSTQDAHEAIRPAHFNFPPEKIKEQLTTDQFKLYRLIWERFLASQMASAMVNATSIDIASTDHIFRLSGETLLFPGHFLATDAEGKEKGTKHLPQLNEGEILTLQRLLPEQKFTQPPPRYNEASLIKTMEEEGIGRPSTYAPTLSTIIERNYAEKENKLLIPTDLGTVVTDLLRMNFKPFIDVKFTAKMEELLDEVETGKKDWVELLSEFYPNFHEHIIRAGDSIAKLELPVEETGEICPECGGNLVIKDGRFGKFIACNNFPKCKFTKHLEENVGAHCPKCKADLLARKTRRGTKFYVCAKNNSDPNCDFISWDLPIDESSCETCGSYMVLHRFRNRLLKQCGNPDCPTKKRKTATKKESDTGEKDSAAKSGKQATKAKRTIKKDKE